MGKTNLQITYKGKSGTEKFTIFFMGKKMTYSNIGTNSKNDNRILDSSEPTDLVIAFGNAGTAKITTYKEKTERVCRRRRRWGRRRRRCENRTSKIPITTKKQRRVIIENLKINGFDLKDNLAMQKTSCDPKKGNVSKDIKIKNGTLIKGGKYTISRDLIRQSVGEFVPKPELDAALAKIPPYKVANKTLEDTVDDLTNKYGTLTAEHSQLQRNFDRLKKRNKSNEKKVVTAGNKINLLRTDASDLNGQIAYVEQNLNDINQSRAFAHQQYQSIQGNYYQEIEKENSNINQENRERGHANDTFKQKTFYQKEATLNLEIYNAYALYIYFFFVFAFTTVYVYIDNKNKTFSDNLYGKIFFLIIAILYPFIIHYIAKYAINFFNYLYAIFNSKTYNEKIY